MLKNRLNNILFLCLTACVFSCTSSYKTLTVLHTNDTHSQVESNHIRLGGYAARMDMIDSLRNIDKNIILVDAGDFLQGTPYYNFYKGIVEINAIKLMKYDAITLGNHEFDNGVLELAQLLSQLNLPVICSNYNVQGTPLEPHLKKYHIIVKNKIKIGIIGLGINPKGLISDKNFEGIMYLDPIISANTYAQHLKLIENCDVIICLSHLGDNSPLVNDIMIASNSKYIDLIVGGHTHKCITDLKVKNSADEEVTIVQAGKRGDYLGEVKIKVRSVK